MVELLRSLVVHQARFQRALLDSWGASPAPDRIDVVLEALVHDGLWLTKFPLLWSPTYGVERLDALNKRWAAGPRDEQACQQAASELVELRPRVDADTLRFVRSLTTAVLEDRVELFFGGRAMNKPLWQYLLAWFEHAAVLRGRLGGPGLFDTAFS